MKFLNSLVIALIFLASQISSAHNKVVVIPLSEDSPLINMQCQDGGLEYDSCSTCGFSEVSACCSAQSAACSSDAGCVALSLCILNCSDDPSCISSCKSVQPAAAVALYDDVGLCLNGGGGPNLDGACGLICAPQTMEPPTPPDQDIYVELTWSTPGDPDENNTGPAAGSDLDLHFAHQLAMEPDLDGDEISDPWFDAPFDTFWFNPNPNWANFDPMIDDNPMLLLDDPDGKGPEIIVLNNPEALEYEVGVYAAKDNGFGDSLATVTVWSEGTMVYSGAAILRERDMWWVGKVLGGSASFSPHTGAATLFRITPNYEHSSFPP